MAGAAFFSLAHFFRERHPPDQVVRPRAQGSAGSRQTAGSVHLRRLLRGPAKGVSQVGCGEGHDLRAGAVRDRHHGIEFRLSLAGGKRQPQRSAQGVVGLLHRAANRGDLARSRRRRRRDRNPSPVPGHRRSRRTRAPRRRPRSSPPRRSPRRCSGRRERLATVTVERRAAHFLAVRPARGPAPAMGGPAGLFLTMAEVAGDRDAAAAGGAGLRPRRSRPWPYRGHAASSSLTA